MTFTAANHTEACEAASAMFAALKEASEMAERHELLNMRQRNALLSAIASAEAAGIGDRP